MLVELLHACFYPEPNPLASFFLLNLRSLVLTAYSVTSYRRFLLLSGIHNLLLENNLWLSIFLLLYFFLVSHEMPQTCFCLQFSILFPWGQRSNPRPVHKPVNSVHLCCPEHGCWSFLRRVLLELGVSLFQMPIFILSPIYCSVVRALNAVVSE